MDSMDNERYKLILDIAAEGFWDWNLKTSQAYLSPRYCELIGYSPVVFDSGFLKQIIHPDDHQHSSAYSMNISMENEQLQLLNIA